LTSAKSYSDQNMKIEITLSNKNGKLYTS